MLQDSLPDRDEPEPESDHPDNLSKKAATTTNDVSPGLDTMRTDKRARRESLVVVRQGQAEFRQRVLANHDRTCAISGCQVVQILEAAHISPYAGIHSNHVANGLCLRVDIHRLFDAFLLSIEPVSGKVVIADALSADPEYGALAGRAMRVAKTPASRELLSMHYQSFKRSQGTILEASMGEPV